MIHKLAVIHEGADIANDVKIGPFTVIGANVSIKSGTIIHSNVVIDGHTTIGKNNEIFPFVSLGAVPIDHSYNGEKYYTILGDNNIIREGATIHGGTHKENFTTIIGSNNLFMNYVHIGHDSIIGDNITLVNYCALAGHVKVSNHAIIGAHTGVHQFSHIGENAFIAHGATITQDVPAFLMVTNDNGKATPKGLNTEGMKRREFSSIEISQVKTAYKTLYRRGLRLVEALEKLKEILNDQPSLALEIFIISIEQSNRGIIR